ncbi:HU family DNA-binding protein [Salipiger abyssi]|uniref:DNA-binding protein HU-beta n=1 Tax=Salipiger abyssi TaxID=1250539 RepID=A0A1P8UXM7_9RHOB|nr:HU family DNA-binding protein [Salipiger abyssi]ALF02126.1 DNA-binding protein HU-beta [Pelagibaca phage vB_PeaS-P1]APZ54141.1 DNA-binding protein HU-beta [Salipiger abyssi]
MPNYSKSDLIKDVAARLNHSQAAVKDMLEATLEQISDRADAGDKVTLQGFGSFVVKESAARTGRNPRTGEPVEIAASRRLTFKVSKPKT